MIRTVANGVMMSSLLVSIHMVQKIPLVELPRRSGTLALEIPERGRVGEREKYERGKGGRDRGREGGREKREGRGVRNSFACIYVHIHELHVPHVLYMHTHNTILILNNVWYQTCEYEISNYRPSIHSHIHIHMYTREQ